MKSNCWEHTNCGRMPGGEHVHDMGVCPAAKDRSSNEINDGKNGGRICWAVTGTFCGGEAQGTFAQKKMSCMSCDFYKKVKKEEGSDFLLLRPGQEYSRKK